MLDPFENVLADYRSGRMIIIVDDATRENEGDLAVASEHATPESLAFMMREARGLICVSLDANRARDLGLHLQTTNNQSRYGTAFTISVDLKDAGGPGVTAAARAETIRRLIARDASPEEFMTPGHVFPLIAHERGVLGRRGQTEGSYDMARLAGLIPSGVICEILNSDGTMARGAQLNTFAARFQLKRTSVEAIANAVRAGGEPAS